MQRLFPQKLLTIITVDTLEETLVKIVRTRGRMSDMLDDVEA